MRKFYYLAAALLLASVVGCQEEIASNEPEKVVIETVYAVVDNGDDTRTSLNENNLTLWTENDQISVFAGSTANNPFILSKGAGETYGEFRVNGLSAGTESAGEISSLSAIVAYYPYDSKVTVKANEGVYTINATFPATQTYSASGTFGNGAAPAVAATASIFDANLKFKNVGSVIKVKLKGDATITKVVFSANADLAGNCNITASNTAVPTVEVVDGSQTVTIDCGEGVKLSAETATTFVAAILPIARLEGGMTVSFYDNNGKKMDYTYGADKVREIQRSLSYTMPEELTYTATQEAELVVKTAEDLFAIAEQVNSGSEYFEGKTIVLANDIDLAGKEWTPIGSAAKDHGFMGNFDGKGYTIKNLTIENIALDSDGYAYAGLFGVTEGTDKDNQNYIGNFTIENVTISTPGHIASAAIAYPYYTVVENITVKGDIEIEGGDYTAGVLAYTRRCVDAMNLEITGNAGSSITGGQVVGGVISDIQMNGGLKANYSNFTASGLNITGTKNVGGISGIISNQTLDGAAVENVVLEGTSQVGIVSGSLGDASVIKNIATNNVTGATDVIGGVYSTAKPVEARVGDTYYATLVDALAKVEAGETITLLHDINSSEIITIDKEITLDGNGKTLTSTAGRAINVSGVAEATIKNLTINASGERAINIIQNSKKVIIDNVTATAANYAVNVAASAPKVKVTISKSTLTGLNVVNVAAPSAEVTVSESTLNCNDKNASEGYAVLALHKDAVGAKITATDCIINIPEGSGSLESSNGAEGGEIIIDGSSEAEKDVAAIIYGDNYYGFPTIASALEFAKAGETITLLRDVESSEILVIDKNITLDGNGKTLTSTAGRAINVSGVAEATIKNLTINASGERAINIIQNSKKVIIDNVTATAANYTVNVAGSAPGVQVAISNSTLTGLNVVNVAGAGANVTVSNSTINCNDTNPTPGEDYAALTLNKDAVNGKITATGCTINVTEGSDSFPGNNGAEGGVVTIDGSTDGVTVMVAYIVDSSDYYYAFPSLAAALEFAKPGQTVTLLRDVESSEILVINKNITLDGNGKTLTSTAGRAINVSGVAEATIKNLTINASGERAINIIQNSKKVIIDNVTATAANYTVNVAGSAPGVQVAISNSTLTGLNVVNVAGAGANVTVSNSTINCNDTSDIEGYAALCLNKDAVDGKIIATNCVVNVTGGSYKGSNGAKGGVVTINGSTEGVKSIVAIIDYGTNYYSFTTLKSALAKVEAGETIILQNDVELTEALVVEAGKNFTLDLNGKTISHEKECTASYEMINNKGTLKITGNGKISFKDTSAGDPSFGWGSYTIRNEGNLTVENGTIEHLGAQDFATHMICAIFQYSGSTTINGGTISTPNYRSVRLWKGDMTINGGEFDGQLWVQAVDNSASLTINGGTFGPNGGDGSSVFVGNADYNVALAVNDGTFTTKIGCSDANKEGVNGSVKGGDFTEAAKNGTNSALIAEGYEFAEAAGGNWTVSKATKSWDVNGNTYTIYNAKGMQWFANEVNVNKNTFAGKTVILANNIDLNNENWVPVGQTGATQFMGTFDGNGKTISNLNIDQTAQEGKYYSTGIFGWLNKAIVKNVKVNGAIVKGNHNVGVIAGYLETAGCTIENCHVSNAEIECHVKNDDANGDKCGAIVGHAGNDDVAVKNCTATDCTISAGRDAGQVVGAAKEVNVTGCSASNVTVTANGEGTGANISNAVIGRLL